MDSCIRDLKLPTSAFIGVFRTGLIPLIYSFQFLFQFHLIHFLIPSFSLRMKGVYGYLGHNKTGNVRISHLYDTLNIESEASSTNLRPNVFANCPSHPNPLDQQIGNYKLDQWYSTWGTRTPGGTRRHLRGYVKFKTNKYIIS